MQAVKAFICFFSGILILSPVLANGECLSIPAKSENPPISFCETPESITYKVYDDYYTYDKKVYFSSLKKIALQSTLNAGIPHARVESGNLQFWLSIPEINPAALQGRAAISTADFEIIINLPIFMEKWHDNTTGFVAINDKSFYPKAFGYSVGKLILATATELTDSDIETRLSEISPELQLKSKIASNRYTVSLPPLTENRWASRLQANAEDPATRWIKSTELNQVVEWIAHRASVFSFSLSDVE